jgi:hypothetical protein
VHALVLARDSSMVAGGVGAGMRFGRGLRVGATLSSGWLAPDAWAGRGEALVAYHLYPVRPGGAGWYLAGGVAAELVRGQVRGLVQALLGVEARPWRGGGLFAEVGVGEVRGGRLSPDPAPETMSHGVLTPRARTAPRPSASYQNGVGVLTRWRRPSLPFPRCG